jgi:uncharacterized phage protein (TIGR01671 family)
MKFRAYDKRERKMYSPEEVENKNWTLGSNGIIVAADEDSFKAKDGITLWMLDHVEPSFFIGKLDSLENEIFQGDILKFTLDPVLADTISGGGEVEHFVVSNLGLKLNISNYNFVYDEDILDSPAVLAVEVIGNVYETPEKLYDFPELKEMIEFTDEEVLMENESTTTEEVKCDLCSHTWTATFDVEDEQIDCPNCKNHAHFEPVNSEDD